MTAVSASPSAAPESTRWTRRLPPVRGGPQGQRRRHDLRGRRHPDHRPRPRRAGFRNPLHRLSARDLGRQCRRRRRIPHQPPGVCLTVSAPGFLNGLPALANATTNCFPMIQISGSGNRAMVDLQRGDYGELDQLNAARPFAKAAYRISRIEDIGRGVARAIRTAISGRPGGVYLDIPGDVLGQAMDAVRRGGHRLASRRPRSPSAAGAGGGRPRARRARRRRSDR